MSDITPDEVRRTMWDRGYRFGYKRGFWNGFFWVGLPIGLICGIASRWLS